MGRKPGAESAKTEEVTPVTVDPPVVVELKAVDDKCLAVEQELEKELMIVRRRFKAQIDPLLEERKKILDKPSDTPDADEADFANQSCRGFWFTALKRCPSTTDEIEEHDAPALQYLSDIRADDLDPLDEKNGFKLDFLFVENPYFTNDKLTVEFHCKETNPYYKEISCTAIKSTEIAWKPDKNITIEKVAKKVKGGGAKKKKGKATEEPRDSFFRSTFRNLKLGDDLPEDLNMDDMDEEDDDFVEQFLDNQMESFRLVKDCVVPHAVRCFTGEAFPEQEDDDDDEESEEEDGDGDDDESDSEPSPAAKKKGAPKKAEKKKGSPKEKEECKQQ